jgi:hypothetical protein
MVDFGKRDGRPRRLTLLRVLPTLGFVFVLAAVVHAEAVLRHRIMAGTPYETEYFVKSTQDDYGPKVCVIGGVHGNEVAGYLAARKLVNWRITRGTLIVLPDAHKEAIRRNVRGYPGNMNAMFPGDPNGSDMQRLAYEIWSTINYHRPGLLVTLHESIGFHKRDPTKYGYTLCHDFAVLDTFFQRCIDRVNPDIADPLHKFEVFVEPHSTCPTYCAWTKLGIPATSIETCMDLGLATRVRHQLMMCMGLFDEAGLGYEQADAPRLSTSAQPPPSALEFWSPHLAAVQRGLSPPADYALLFVRSNQLEARVFLDGVYRGCTPAPIAVETGGTEQKVRIYVDKVGFAPWQGDIILRPNARQTVSVPLRP